VRPRARAAREGHGVTRRLFLAGPEGPREGRRITAVRSRDGGSASPAAPWAHTGPRLRHAGISVLCRSPPRPGAAPGARPRPPAVPRAPRLGWGQLGSGELRDGRAGGGRVGSNRWAAKFSLPLPEGCVFLSGAPSPLHFPTMTCGAHNLKRQYRAVVRLPCVPHLDGEVQPPPPMGGGAAS
jgi:hypothetical protein